MTLYCTYSDMYYLPRLLTLLSSITTQEPQAQFIVLALDRETESYFSTHKQPGVEVFGVELLESTFPDLLNVRSHRSSMEYIFTLTPLLFCYAMTLTDPGDLVIYLDADLFFFGSPGLVTSALSGGDVGIIPHSYPIRHAKSWGKFGTYNVGWVGIRNSDNGRACAEWWAERCLEWCSDTPLDGKYADQGYLDQFPELFKGVKILENRGFNLAPWNTFGQKISQDGKGRVLVGDQTQLIFFHFHGLKRFGKWMATSQLNYRSPASKELIELVYQPYLTSLKRAEELVSIHTNSKKAPKLVRGRGLRRLARTIVTKILVLASILTGNGVDMSKLK